MNLQLHFTIPNVIAVIAGITILIKAEVIEFHCSDLSHHDRRYWDSGTENLSMGSDTPQQETTSGVSPPENWTTLP